MAISEKKAENLIKIWERAVQTQMHFNEMSVKSRQLGFTFVVAALGAAAYTLSKPGEFTFELWGGLQFHVGLLLAIIGGLAVFAIKQLDLGVYHRMLRGAVTFGEDFEANHLAKYLRLNKGMTQAISHYSRYGDAAKKTVRGKYVYSGATLKSAEDKLRAFYLTVICLVIAFALAIAVFTNWKIISTALAAKPLATTQPAKQTLPIPEKKN
jgi:hypothetical protein